MTCFFLQKPIIKLCYSLSCFKGSITIRSILNNETVIGDNVAVKNKASYLGRMRQKDTGRERKETQEANRRQTDKCQKIHMILK